MGIDIPQGVTSIRSQTFSNCEKLVEVIIPDSVTKIEGDAFSGSSLVKIYGVNGSFAQTYANGNSIPFIGSAPLNVKVTGVTVSETTKIMSTGADFNLTATISPANATNKDVIWSSNKTDIATVDATGKVTAVSAGTATITVTTTDGSKTASCTVTVNKPTILLIDDITANVIQNDIYNLPSTVLANLNNGKTLEIEVAWQPISADTSVIGTYTFVGSVVEYDGNVNLTLNVQKYAPDLNIFNYSSITINNVCKQLSLNIKNDGDRSITINKIEVYESGILVNTYSKSQLIDNNISADVTPQESWGMSISYKIGIWIDNSFVKYYIESDGNSYEYEVSIPSPHILY